MVTRSEFSCQRCQDCCKYLTVKISRKEIEKIKKLGYSDFYDYDTHIKSHIIKMDEHGCFFLKKDGSGCTIYRDRPKVCREYPFGKLDEVESCRPALLKYKFKKN
ncbi:MAG: YkgJ family cysteine cluster protein [Nanoarchaeota archaeon]|nr:YkgJ family cysteine cluster protein [Nanoarchaeota archaeon]